VIKISPDDVADLDNFMLTAERYQSANPW